MHSENNSESSDQMLVITSNKVKRDNVKDVKKSKENKNFKETKTNKDQRNGKAV